MENATLPVQPVAPSTPFNPTAPAGTRAAALTAAPTPPPTIAGFTANQLEIIKRTVAKGATNDELSMFMHIAKKYDLDPFVKEIWFYKDVKGNAVIFCGRDGFLKVASSSPSFRGIRSGAVRENDEFEIDLASGDVKHKIIKKPAERGALISAWAVCKRDGCDPFAVFVDNATYNKGYSAWKSHPDAMLSKVAEAIALKKVFSISGIYSEEEKDSFIANDESKTPTAYIDEPSKMTPETMSAAFVAPKQR